MMDDPVKQAELYQKLSLAHLQRATMLHQNEWQVAFIMWAAIGAGTVTAVVNGESLFPLPMWFGLPAVALFYAAMAVFYLYGYCQANYKSLTEERGRYRYFQNRALELVGAPEADMLLEKGVKPQNGEKPKNSFRGSDTWLFKTRSTALVHAASLTVIGYMSNRVNVDLWSLVGTALIYASTWVWVVGDIKRYGKRLVIPA
jgi:hypothetical protein